MSSRLLGIYIDCVEMESIGDARICLVERTRGGKIVVRSSDDECPMSAVMQRMSLDQLSKLMDMLHTPRNEAAS